MTYQPCTVWHGGRPAYLPPMTIERVEAVEVVRVAKIVPTRICPHCLTVFPKRHKESKAEFTRRKFCSSKCAASLSNQLCEERKAAIMKTLPAQIKQMMVITGLTYNEITRTIARLVEDKKICSEPNGRHQRIYRATK